MCCVDPLLERSPLGIPGGSFHRTVILCFPDIDRGDGDGGYGGGRENVEYDDDGTEGDEER